ncbi:NAD-dependent epimerase/dehydratase family protein, partial [Pseudomonas aeruginosa]|uniref:NAD-dependent epimerase/dehydratase family protein n=1 Tax=Pseudomonas aeruginosa TaxID=287 RepID=UPI002F946F40
EISYVTYTRRNQEGELGELLKDADAVLHLAGVNRPQHEREFTEGNVDLTEALLSAIRASGRKIPVLYTSSIQAECNNPY